MAGIFSGDQNHIDGLFLGFAGLAGFDEGIGLDNSLGGQFSHGLQRTGFDLASQNGFVDIIGAVETNHDNIFLAGSQQGSLGAQRHGVVTADDTLHIGIGLEQAFHHIVGFRLAPVGRLLGYHFHIRQRVQNFVVSV